jgi:hypothetical protein
MGASICRILLWWKFYPEISMLSDASRSWTFLCYVSFWKGNSTYRARHTLCGLESSEVAKCFTPLQCSTGKLRCSRRTGRGLGPRFCNHTTSNAHNESQAVKGRTHRRSRTPQVWRPLDWQGQALERVEGEGNIAQDKKFEPSSLATYVLALPSPRACRGWGIRRAEKNHVEQVYEIN